MRLYRHTPLFALVFVVLLFGGCGGKSVEESRTTAPVAPSAPVTAQSDPAAPPSDPSLVGSAPTIAPGGRPVSPRPTAGSKAGRPVGRGGAVHPSWNALLDRLRKDNVDEAILSTYFAGLPEYSSAPMSVKVKELYKIAFTPKTPRDPNAPPPSSVYRNVITKANVDRCKTFMQEHAVSLKRMEEKYAVPKEVVTSLLFVETRLGTQLGKEQAFWSLACMAASDNPQLVGSGISELDITPEREPWLQAKLTDKSDWAYKELKAMMTFCSTQSLDPQSMPGSVYGAVGICQFMPSNLSIYGADGDGDGKIDLFVPEDAIHSAASYLSSHGWKSTASVDARRKVIKRYNNSNRYANTILALAKSIRTGVLLAQAPTD